MENKTYNIGDLFGRHKKIAGGAAVIVIIILFGYAVVAMDSFSNSARPRSAPVVPAAEVGKEATAEQEPVQAEQDNTELVVNPSSSPASDTPSLQDIPGLTAADIKLNFKDLGFACKGPDIFDADDEYNVSWSCEEKTTGHWYYVDWFGRNATNIGAVSATAQDYLSKTPTAEMREFLGYVASLPYDGADPADAKSWVEKLAAQSNDGSLGQKTIGGVEFCVSKAAQTLYLDIAKEDCEK